MTNKHLHKKILKELIRLYTREYLYNLYLNTTSSLLEPILKNKGK